jgi:serine/threonine protein kinase
MSGEGKQNESWHMDFASKVQENTDGRGAGGKTGDDPLGKTLRSRDLRSQMAAARESAGLGPGTAGSSRRQPRRAPPRGPPPSSSPLNAVVRRQAQRETDAGSKTPDGSRRKSREGVRPPPRNPYRPPPGKPPAGSPSSISSSRQRRMPPGSRGRPAPAPRGINPHSIDNRSGGSTARLIAFATRHQAQIQKQQAGFVRRPPSGPVPLSVERRGGGVRLPPQPGAGWKPPPPVGAPPPPTVGGRGSSSPSRRPPRPSEGDGSKRKPPPPSGPPPASAIEAGRRARSRQSGDGFNLGGTSDGEDEIAAAMAASKIDEPGPSDGRTKAGEGSEPGGKVSEPVKKVAEKKPKKMKKRPKLSIMVDDSNKDPSQPSPAAVATAGQKTVDEGKVGEAVGKKKKKRPNLRVTVEDSNHEASSPSNADGDAGGGGNPFSGVGALQISVDDNPNSFNETYHMSNSGAFNAEGFIIRETGIARAPNDGKGSARGGFDEDGSGYGKNIKKEMLKLCVLGRGASGIVYKSLHIPTMKIVAVKNIPVYETEKRHQMIHELKALNQNLVPISGDGSMTARGGLKLGPCPQIVSFHDAFMNPEEGNISIILEYMDGGSLQDIVDTGGCSQESVLANVSYRVLVALQFLHDKNQIHRDIKPSNLLINHNGEVKVSDFGIVKEVENTVAQANTFVGTLTYMSPERISGEPYSFPSDIWSFGLSVLAIALGKYPLNTEGGYWGLLHNLRDEPSPKLPDDEFSPEFCEFIDLCLYKDPKERWTCAQLLAHPFLEGCGEAMDQQQREIHERFIEAMEGFEEDEDEDMQFEGSDTARTELGEICELSMNCLYDLWSAARQGQDEGKRAEARDSAKRGRLVPSQFPRISRSKLGGLANQLGLPVGSVVRCFERKWRELTGAGYDTARRAAGHANRHARGEPDVLRMIVAEGSTDKKK